MRQDGIRAGVTLFHPQEAVIPGRMRCSGQISKVNPGRVHTPCVAAVATVKREMGGAKAAAGTVIVQCAIAWVVAFAVHSVGAAVGLV